jgi:hypothetical protein
MLIAVSTATSAALVDNGGGLIYDTVLDITWAQPDALRNWYEARTWAAGLTLGGVSGWRLPYISVAAGESPISSGVVDCHTASEIACRDNELGYMFYHNLGGTFGQPILSSGDPDLALFPTLQPYDYWSGSGVFGAIAWGLAFANGTLFSLPPELVIDSWAVHEGNVGIPVVPVPAAAWLFASGLLALVGMARKKAA